MSNFFINKNNINNNKIIISNDDYHHIADVLRAKTGDILFFCDEYFNKYKARIININKQNIILEIEEKYILKKESKNITLYQGLPKFNKLEYIVQKAVELGVCKIVPVIMERTIVNVDAEKINKKYIRLNEISKHAAEQSQRNFIPKVEKIIKFNQAINNLKNEDFTLVPYELESIHTSLHKVLKDIKDKKNINVFIAPEGGFSPKEIEYLRHIKAITISLGKHILRTETASLCMLSILLYEINL